VFANVHHDKADSSAILDRFLHRTELLQMARRSYGLRQGAMGGFELGCYEDLPVESESGDYVRLASILAAAPPVTAPAGYG
jgi:hypothetical protein